MEVFQKWELSKSTSSEAQSSPQGIRAYFEIDSRSGKAVISMVPYKSKCVKDQKLTFEEQFHAKLDLGGLVKMT